MEGRTAGRAAAPPARRSRAVIVPRRRHQTASDAETEGERHLPASTAAALLTEQSPTEQNRTDQTRTPLTRAQDRTEPTAGRRCSPYPPIVATATPPDRRPVPGQGAGATAGGGGRPAAAAAGLYHTFSNLFFRYSLLAYDSMCWGVGRAAFSRRRRPATPWRRAGVRLAPLPVCPLHLGTPLRPCMYYVYGF